MNDDENTKPLSRVEEKWSNSADVYSKDGFKVFWESLELPSAYQIQEAFGDTPWIENILSRIPDADGRSDLRALALGCSHGDGVAANEFVRSGRFEEITVVDLSSKLLASQQELTDDLGLGEILRYRRMDLENDPWEFEQPFDLIFAIGTLHHIERLERLFSEINTHLSPSGLFCMREYVGPDRFQYGEKQVEIVSEIMRALPERLRTDVKGQVCQAAWQPTIDEVVEDDPSEAIRSSELLDLANRFLSVDEIRLTGGSLLDPLLHGIAGHFENNPGGREILPLLIVFEKILVRKGVLPSDYAFLFAHKL
ncbi:MAG: class I SAM-dependent methyltransferase [bacterium]|nr:class I SAM-dependent methyltransferase [bacterium]